MSEQNSDSPKISVGVLVNHFGGVLLVKQGDHWQMPRGDQLWQESLPQAVERIVKQQSGIEVTAGDIIQAYDLIDPEAGQHLVMIDFEAAFDGGDLKPGEEVEDVAWASGLALKSMAVEESTAELLADMGVI